MATVVSLGVHILDVLGRPVTRIPDGQNIDLLEEIRFTVAGTAAGAAIDLAKLGESVIAMGANGSAYADASGVTLRVPAFKVNVVDTTGCGDAYCAGFIAGLARGWDIEQSMRLATAASGLVATGLGSDAGIVDFDQTVAFMRSAEPLPMTE